MIWLENRSFGVKQYPLDVKYFHFLTYINHSCALKYVYHYNNIAVSFQIEMRNIDIMILRQLMNIHETIQTLMKSKVVITRTQSCQNCSFHNKLTKLTSFKEDRSIIRQQSTPSFCNLSSSCSSLEGKYLVLVNKYFWEKNCKISFLCYLRVTTT